MIVWLLLICSALFGFGGYALSQRNREAVEASKQIMRTRGTKAAPIGCLVAVVGYGTPVLWTIYAIQVHDWRFAAITWLPVAFRALGWMVNYNTPPERVR